MRTRLVVLALTLGVLAGVPGVAQASREALFITER